MKLRNTTPLIPFVFLFTAAVSQINDNDSGDLIVFTPNSSQTWMDTDDEDLEPQPLPPDGGPNCKCVEYYLCYPNGTIITNGEGGLLDTRINIQPKCPGVQVCCDLPEEEVIATREPPSPGPTELPPPGPTELPHPGPTELPHPGPTELPPPGSCGVRGGNLDPTRFRILSEDKFTQFGEFPWMLGVFRVEEEEYRRTRSKRFHCGASLIHPQVALTAGQCVRRRYWGGFKIRAGEWDTRVQTEPLPYQDRTVRWIIRHPYYHRRLKLNDIALLILDSPFTLAANVQPICLPQQDAVFDGSHCVATGWGVGAYGRGARIEMTLRKVDLPIVPAADCQEELGVALLDPYFRLHDSFICAGGEPDEDTCQGDGGGPLVCQLPNTTTYVQVGIVSWGVGCGTNNVPGVYTNVARFRNWIDSNLENMKL